MGSWLECIQIQICLYNYWAATRQNQQNDLYAQLRLISAWAPAQSDQSLLSPWRNNGSLAAHRMHSKGSDQTGRMPRLFWVIAGCSGHFVGFVMWQLIFYFQPASMTSSMLEAPGYHHGYHSPQEGPPPIPSIPPVSLRMLSLTSTEYWKRPLDIFLFSSLVYESTGRAIAVTTASALPNVKSFWLKFLKAHISWTFGWI